MNKRNYSAACRQALNDPEFKSAGGGGLHHRLLGRLDVVDMPRRAIKTLWR